MRAQDFRAGLAGLARAQDFRAGLVRLPIFVTGMMGSGKSTVGRVMARRQRAVFIDLDRRIEMLFGRSISELFADSEATFRARESLALRTLIEEPAFCERSAVVATGGGAVLSPENRRLMRGHGRVVHLAVSVETLCRRLSGGGVAKRPLLAQEGLKERLEDMLAERGAAYLDADVTVDGEGIPSDVAKRALTALEALAVSESEVLS